MSNITREKLKGVFSSQEIRKVGTGTTTRKTVTKTFWFVEEEEGGKISILPINSNYVPTGNKKFITKDELLERFSPEPEFYIQSVYPKMRELSKTIERADQSREKGETFSAEFEYDNALQVDVDNVKANFGIGLTYLSRGETDKAENIFTRLVNLEGAFEEEHKHLFNDFGISLRKNKMLDQALEYYLRAETLTRNDDNLFFNIARVYLELKDIDNVLEYLRKTLEIAPKNEMALKFLAWLEAKKMITPEQFKAVMPDAPAGKPSVGKSAVMEKEDDPLSGTGNPLEAGSLPHAVPSAGKPNPLESSGDDDLLSGAGPAIPPAKPAPSSE